MMGRLPQLNIPKLRIKMRSEPFLWIHLAGFALVPLTLAVMIVGLAVGDPLPLFWLELLIIATCGTIPILLMQWYRPFYILSLPLFVIKPERTTLQQQQILSLFKTKRQRVVSAIASLILLLILFQLYRFAPLAAIVASNLPQWRILGIAIASVAFLFTNLFCQVPLSVLMILLTSNNQWEKTQPYPVNQITRDFTLAGLKVNKLLTIDN